MSLLNAIFSTLKPVRHAKSPSKSLSFGRKTISKNWSPLCPKRVLSLYLKNPHPLRKTFESFQTPKKGVIFESRDIRKFWIFQIYNLLLLKDPTLEMYDRSLSPVLNFDFFIGKVRYDTIFISPLRNM